MDRKGMFFLEENAEDLAKDGSKNKTHVEESLANIQVAHAIVPFLGMHYGSPERRPRAYVLGAKWTSICQPGMDVDTATEFVQNSLKLACRLSRTAKGANGKLALNEKGEIIYDVPPLAAFMLPDDHWYVRKELARSQAKKAKSEAYGTAPL